MADGDTDAAARLAFDREKWAAEATLRDREITLKERELKLSNWTNPLTVAVAVGTVAWVGNVALTWWNGRLQRALEQERTLAQHDLDEAKAESERILEVIKTGDPAKVAVNLRFLLDSGLLRSTGTVDRLREYLKKTPEDQLPVLPASGARFDVEPTKSLPPAKAAALETNLRNFVAYLDRIGFPADTEKVHVRIETLEPLNAQYEGDRKTIVIDPRIADDPYPARREYMHHLLFASKKGNQWISAISDIESGLADYLSGSYASDPVLGGQRIAKAFGLNQDFIRRLDNARTYVQRQPGDQPHEHGEIWGGAFWDIRTKLGQETTDRAVAHAWLSMPWPVPENEIVRTFVATLLPTFGDSSAADIAAILRHRKIPVPR